MPPLKIGFTRLNEGSTPSPPTRRATDEGYLFYVPWLNHNTNSCSTLQDAHGPLRRGIVMQSAAAPPGSPTASFDQRPFLRTLLAGHQPCPTTPEIC